MPALLFVAFIVVPLIELAVIIQVGQVIGAGPTIVILLLDSLIGAYLVRKEGRRAWQAFREALADARWPGDEVAQGALILVGGALMLTPGFVTDVAGLLAVAPPSRALLSRLLRARLTPGPVQVINTTRGGSTRRGSTRTGSAQSGRSADQARRRRAGSPGPGPGSQTYDVEVVSVERDEPPSMREGGEVPEAGEDADGRAAD